MKLLPVLALAALSAMNVGCASDEAGPQVVLDAKAGQPCTPCATCSTTAKSCVCVTCTDYARDVEAKVLLACTSSGWTVYKKCPGGVSVTCTSSGTYRNSCLDETGKEVP